MTKIIHVTQINRVQMCENMDRYGGSFVVALSECFMRADFDNLIKLSETFPEYVSKYMN